MNQMCYQHNRDIQLESVKRKRIFYDLNSCSGCRTCEAVCSLFHEGTVSPELSRIKIATWEYEGWRSEIYICKQCRDAECLASCTEGAIYIDHQTGAKVVYEEKCIGCKKCIKACPCTPSRMGYNAEKVVCVKCDLCGGDPQCVKYCQGGALSYR